MLKYQSHNKEVSMTKRQKIYRLLAYCSLFSFALHSAAFAQGPQEESEAKSKFLISDNYVHEWLATPTIEGESIFGDRTLTFTPRYGRSVALIFISSWCIPCQNLMPELMGLYKKHSKLFSDIIFVFSNDTAQDAQGFAQEYNLEAPAILANDKLLDLFNQPESPTIYIGDRRGWLTKRMKSSTREDIKRADQFLTVLARG
jgi:thiol-disulfide isomerase/thioredoxin